MMKKEKKLRFRKNYSPKVLALWGAVFGAIGIVALLLTSAATTITIDSTLPVPQNIKAYPDDRNIIVTWDSVNNNRVIGYYLTYRPKGSSEAFKVRQTEYNAIQLQPLTNGVEYEIFVQSASGTYKTASAGSLVYSGNQNVWGIADGKVSNKSTVVSSAPSSARVDQMRSRLTSFFDDFNAPAGPMDELKWNHATTACARAGSAAAFINDQFHSHNTVGSAAPGEAFCDRAGIASRPRGVFDTSTATEANPTRIEFDVDGASHPRDTWYLDIIPLSARTNNLPLDITSHNDLFDTDTQNPGNMLRINARRDSLSFAYYDAAQSPSTLNLFTEQTACAQSWRGNATLDYTSCTMSQKTAGISPLPQNTLSPEPIPNVRRHWVVTVSPTKIRLYIDGTFMASANLPSAMASAKKFTLQSTVFSYNTGKIDGGTQDGSPVPSIQMLHWDNFGFSGPAQTEIVYNYLEGGANGTNPTYASGDSSGYRIPRGSRKTIIPIPDDIGNLVNGQARLYYTIGGFEYDTSNWTSGDHILVNGKKYDVPNPNTQMSKVSNPLAMNNLVTSFTMPINKADLIKGNNTVEFKFANGGASFINVHMELPYSSSDSSRPSYTQPINVFGTKFYDISQPPIMNCDQYRYVEQDLGLPYQAGKSNIPTGGACELLPKGSHHNTTGGTGTTPPPPPPADSTAPSISFTSPTGAQTISSTGTFDTTVNATDSVGVTTVEFMIDGQVKYTDTTAPYAATIRAVDTSTGQHSLTARAFDAAGNSATTTTSISFTVQAPATTGTRFETLPVGATLPTEAECAARVKPVAELASRATINASYNARKGSGGNYYYPRVTGNYTGSTDEIIQWAACKWGIDEDLLRAQAVQESYWYQNAMGDFTTDAASCTPVLPVKNYPAQYTGDSAHTGQCPESVGLLQVRWNYHKSAFFSSTTESTATMTNNAVYSTAYNIDYYGAVWRECFEGAMTWLNTVERGETYVAGDASGCQGVWFSGRWKTAPALTYMASVQSHLANKTWTTQAFANVTSPNPVLTPGTTQTDTTAPTVSLTAPTNGQTVSGTVGVSANASDAVGVTSVAFYLDGSVLPFSTDTSAPYSASWNSAAVSNGTHSIVAKAMDAQGNTGTSTSVSFTVSNVVPDTTAPTTSVTAPSNNATVSGTVTITASASDAVGVSKVELYVDNVLKATDTTSPYSFAWDTTSVTNASHTIRTRAYDSAGNSGQSALVTVTVSNVVTPPALKPGDVNGDGLVNSRDASIIFANWGRTGMTRAQGDLNGDGTINVRDYSILSANWGK